MLESVSTEVPARNRANEAFAVIRNEILSGRLAPGSKINEPQLSKQLGISRGPLREAIRQLEGCRLVTIQPNVGAKVVSLNESELIDIYEVRENLEGLACRLAATRSGPEQCAELREVLARHEQTLQDTDGRRYFPPPEQPDSDLDFHQLILRISGNSQLLHLLGEELYYLLRLYRHQTSTRPARPQQAFDEHHRIVDAIEAGDGELAELLMRRHIRKARELLILDISDR